MAIMGYKEAIIEGTKDYKEVVIRDSPIIMGKEVVIKGRVTIDYIIKEGIIAIIKGILIIVIKGIN